MAIKVLIVEDHPLVRAGIRALLDVSGDIRVVADAKDRNEALRQYARHAPDLVLMDLTLPTGDGVAAIQELLRRHPGARVIALSMEASATQVRRAQQAGAAGFLLKHLVADFAPAIRAVAAGQTFISRSLRYTLASAPAPLVARETATAYLTPRQEEILKLIAQGNTTKEIARQLGISIKTAQTHRTQLMERLDIHDVAGLVRYAIRNDLVTPDK